MNPFRPGIVFCPGMMMTLVGGEVWMGALDEPAMRALYDAHAPALRRYVERLIHDAARAEDIAQEALLRAWRNGIADGDERTARAWLFTVARNLVIDDRRSARARHEHVPDTLPDRAVADRTDAIFDSMLVTEALDTLTVDHREAIVRAYFGRATVNEIAADLDLPPGTVKSRLHYGMRALRLALQERGVTR